MNLSARQPGKIIGTQEPGQEPPGWVFSVSERQCAACQQPSGKTADGGSVGSLGALYLSPPSPPCTAPLAQRRLTITNNPCPRPPVALCLPAPVPAEFALAALNMQKHCGFFQEVIFFHSWIMHVNCSCLKKKRGKICHVEDQVIFDREELLS